jgi:hypothetical protein
LTTDTTHTDPLFTVFFAYRLGENLTVEACCIPDGALPSQRIGTRQTRSCATVFRVEVIPAADHFQKHVEVMFDFQRASSGLTDTAASDDSGLIAVCGWR